MAQAYDYMTPFVRFNYFVTARISEIKDEIKALEAEQRMWAEPSIQNYKNVSAGIILHREMELSARLNVLKIERAGWERVDSALDKCLACNDFGEIGQSYDQDDVRFSPCKKCNGKGTGG